MMKQGTDMTADMEVLPHFFLLSFRLIRIFSLFSLSDPCVVFLLVQVRFNFLGGQRDAGDKSSVHTAQREFNEETAKILSREVSGSSDVRSRGKKL